MLPVIGMMLQFSNYSTEQTHPSQPPALSGHPSCTDKSKYMDFDSESDEEHGQEEEKVFRRGRNDDKNKNNSDAWSAYPVPGTVVSVFQSHESGTIKYPFYR